jgi:MoxR-like ATPase
MFNTPSRVERPALSHAGHSFHNGAMRLKPFTKVSDPPTNPHPQPAQKQFDVADLYTGPVADVQEGAAAAAAPLDEKLRQAYFWIVNTAIISPFYDVEYNGKQTTSFVFGDSRTRVTLPSDQSYSSFVLMPLLNLVLRKRCLLVGGPGRGKTATAVLMGLVAGYSMKEIRQAIQHGQPQMTISDLLGNPLPSTLVAAKSMEEIEISWRKWLGMRVKIIDEYNRIPTRTQSALLTVLADNYAEILDHVYECPEAAWFLTANDDAGGGTYQVIEALRDRIDIVVKALHFNTRFLGDLLLRIEGGIKPEDVIPSQIIFSEREIDGIHKEILAVTIPVALLRRIEFFTSNFEFCEAAGEQLEYKTKDTVKLSGVDYNLVVAQETGKDKVRDIGTQTRNGLSVRALMTLLSFAKALAWFRGNAEVSFEDVRQIIPFVLHDKLTQNSDSPFFEAPESAVYRTDKVGWIRKLFDLSSQEYDRLDLDHDDPLRELEEQFVRGLDGLAAPEVRNRLVKIERILNDWSRGRKFYGHMFDDVLKLKYLHQRYTNYLRWLEWQH